MRSLGSSFRVIVVGSSGGIGRAFVEELSDCPACTEVVGLSRAGGFDLTDEGSIADAAANLPFGAFELLIVATGALASGPSQPEKTIRRIEAAAMLEQFAVNAVGPALVLKHFAPRLARDRRSIAAVLSARVGSIGDNRLGGWISYRASKAALNQIVRTTAIELARSCPQAVLAALHPGTVETRLSDPFAGSRNRLAPRQSAARLLGVLDGLSPDQSGGFFAYDGSAIEW